MRISIMDSLPGISTKTVKLSTKDTFSNRYKNVCFLSRIYVEDLNWFCRPISKSKDGNKDGLSLILPNIKCAITIPGKISTVKGWLICQKSPESPKAITQLLALRGNPKTSVSLNCKLSNVITAFARKPDKPHMNGSVKFKCAFNKRREGITMW